MSEINYKIVLIGSSNCGKKIFFRKLSTGEFYEKNISTIGVEKKTLELDLDIVNKGGKSMHQKFVLSFFDTEGQEKFRSITHNYYKGSDGIFFLYDITDKYSFESVENWIGNIKKDSLVYNIKEKYAFVLIGNKYDFEEEDNLERKVTEYEAKRLCDEYDMIWGGEQNLKNLNSKEFVELLGKYVKEVYKRVGEKTIVKQKIRGNGQIQHIEKIEKIAKEKKSRIKKNSCPSDVSDD